MSAIGTKLEARPFEKNIAGFVGRHWPLPKKESPAQWPGRTFDQGNDRRSRAGQSASDEWED
jgi:hypothetical protein